MHISAAVAFKLIAFFLLYIFTHFVFLHFNTVWYILLFSLICTLEFSVTLKFNLIVYVLVIKKHLLFCRAKTSSPVQRFIQTKLQRTNELSQLYCVKQIHADTCTSMTHIQCSNLIRPVTLR